MKRMTSTEAARQFRSLMRAAQQEAVVIERLGHPRMVVMSTRQYQQLSRFLEPVPSPSRALGGNFNQRKRGKA